MAKRKTPADQGKVKIQAKASRKPKKKTTTRKRGTNYQWNPTPDDLWLIEDESQKGTPIGDIAKLLKISRSTFDRRRGKIDAIDEAIKKGHDRQDRYVLKNIEKSLEKRAMGFEYEEITRIVKRVGDRTHMEEKKMTKYYAPSDTAIIFYLVNRSDRWRSINQPSMGGENNWINNMKIEGMDWDAI